MNLNKLKFDDFDRFVSNGLGNLYQTDNMSDVTLFTNDGRSFKAHKIILSMFSCYFKDILSGAQHPHPVIILQGLSSAEVEWLLKFIYQGQLFVPMEDTDRFLKIIEFFQIPGLRNIRSHFSSSTGRIISNPTFNKSPETNNFTSVSTNSSGIIDASGGTYQIASLPFSSPPVGTPFAVQTVTSSNNPVHSNSIIPPTGFVHDHSLGHNSQFTSNVIKSNTVQQSKRLDPLRCNSPIADNDNTNRYSCTSTGNRPGTTLKQNQEIVYHSQPILIVHNNQSKSHDNNQELCRNNHDIRQGQEEQILVLERVGSISGMESQKVVSMNDTNHFQHLEEEHPDTVLGLAYMEDNDIRHNSSGGHSSIIHNTTVATNVCVEDSEIIDITRESSFSSSDAMNSSSRSSNKGNSSGSTILTRSTSPVYAVKRIPPHSPPAPQAKPAAASKNKNNMQSGKKSKNGQKQGSSQNNNQVEFQNCPKCNKQVKKSSLKVHIKRTHLEEGTTLVCPLCNKNISSKGVYYKHMWAHKSKAKAESRK